MFGGVDKSQIKAVFDSKKSFDEMKDALMKLGKHIEEVCERQDDITKGVVTLYNNQVSIAKKLDVKLEKPLVDMRIK